MKSSLFLLLILGVFSAVASHADVKVNDALLRFSLKMLAEEKKENTVMSPFSLAMAIAAVNEGAEGRTSQEIDNAVFNGVSKQHINAWYNSKLSNFESLKSSPLSVASAIYVQKDFGIRREYVNSVKENFHAALKLANFRDEADQETKNINKFVNESTHGHIPELLKEGDLDEDARLVAVNALYMEAAFKKEFLEYATNPRKFRNEDGSEKEVPTMFNSFDDLVSMNHELFDYAQIPFTDDSFRFFVLVPKTMDLGDFLKHFANSNESLMEIARQAHSCSSVHVTMPKFNVSSNVQPTNKLKKLGMKSVFSEREADLSGISGDLYLSDVAHIATMEVTEKGVKASAAAAAISRVWKSGGGCFRVVDASRPFLYGITHIGTPLFVGKYY
uniref:SERPIN domain-containing protein n=1 Tax=Steinernema glaseri TaxID=37863 RepID=A0A1I7ZHZ2_9BILA